MAVGVDIVDHTVITRLSLLLSLLSSSWCCVAPVVVLVVVLAATAYPAAVNAFTLQDFSIFFPESSRPGAA